MHLFCCLLPLSLVSPSPAAILIVYGHLTLHIHEQKQCTHAPSTVTHLTCPTTINSAATTTQIRCSAQKCQNTQINCGYDNTDQSMHVCSVDCLGQGACYNMHFECNGDLAQCNMSGNALDSIIDSELQCKNTETSNS